MMRETKPVMITLIVFLLLIAFTSPYLCSTSPGNPFSDLNMSYEELLNMSKTDPFSFLRISLKVFPELRPLVVSIVFLLILLIAVTYLLIIHEAFERIRRRIIYTSFGSLRRKRRFG